MLKNKKGFVLIETIVVIVVVSVSLLTLFTSYNKILNNLRKVNKYDLSEHLYKTNYVKNYIKNNNCSVNVYNLGNSTSNPVDNSSISCNGVNVNLINIFKVFGIKNIYFLSNINGIKTYSNLKYFDAYMVDYIKQLDVDDNSTLIVVEYEEEKMDSNYNPLKIYGTSITLKDTYIASLEW